MTKVHEDYKKFQLILAGILNPIALGKDTRIKDDQNAKDNNHFS